MYAQQESTPPPPPQLTGLQRRVKDLKVCNARDGKEELEAVLCPGNGDDVRCERAHLLHVVQVEVVSQSGYVEQGLEGRGGEGEEGGGEGRGRRGGGEEGRGSVNYRC